MEPNDIGLFPPLPEVLENILSNQLESTGSTNLYEAILESQCGATDDSQPVEQYDGTLGVTREFVDEHERPVGQLQWNSDLASKYDNPGNVSGVRWCTGTLITPNLFLTAGHCFDRTGGGGSRPRIDGTSTIISVEEIAQNMHVNFNFQDDPDGNPRTEQQFAIEELVEYRLGGLDFAIVRLADDPGQTFGVGKLAAGDPRQDEMICIIGHPAGVPKRIEAGPLTSFEDHRIRYNDIDTLGGNSGSAIWHSPTGFIVGVHTNGGCTTSGTGSNFGVRISAMLDASPTLRSVLNGRTGRHTIQQVSNNRFLDAWQSTGRDFSVVTRTAQNNSTQRWILTPVGWAFFVQQKSSRRLMDAHTSSSNDFSVVTRTAQTNDTQKWIFKNVYGEPGAYTIQQMSNGRFLDAHETGSDFSVVTRGSQENFSQQWILRHLGDQTYKIQQKVNGRYLDAHQSSANDFSVVTRTNQNNDTQEWILTPIGGIYTIQQQSRGRYLDAWQSSSKDFSAVTRLNQQNDTQLWVLINQGDEKYTAQQLSSRRYLDAHETSSRDFSVVTRTRQNNNTQKWIIKEI